MTTMWLMRSIAEALGPTDAQAAATRASTITSRRKYLIPLSLRDLEAERTSFRDRSALLTGALIEGAGVDGTGKRGVSGQSDSHGQTDAAAPQRHPGVPRWSGPRTGHSLRPAAAGRPPR